MEIVAHVSNYFVYEEKLIIIDNYKQKKKFRFSTHKEITFLRSKHPEQGLGSLKLLI